jgi:predicted small integral membrane protein
MLIRISKTALVAAAALFLLVVVFNNLTDYDSNYQFVRHVLSMDTTFPGNRGLWRALPAPAIHHAFYASIILWELVSGAMLALGAWKLWRARRRPAAAWEQEKSMAIAGLTLSLLQWFVAFITVGGEWFLMWQSPVWNGQNAAFRMFACLGLILIFVSQRDTEPTVKLPAPLS